MRHVQLTGRHYRNIHPLPPFPSPPRPGPSGQHPLRGSPPLRHVLATPGRGWVGGVHVPKGCRDSGRPLLLCSLPALTLPLRAISPVPGRGAPLSALRPATRPAPHRVPPGTWRRRLAFRGRGSATQRRAVAARAGWRQRGCEGRRGAVPALLHPQAPAAGRGATRHREGTRPLQPWPGVGPRPVRGRPQGVAGPGMAQPGEREGSCGVVLSSFSSGHSPGPHQSATSHRRDCIGDFGHRVSPA